MARKITRITGKEPSKYDLLSQTPKDRNENNYFIKELQDKVDADWIYRPNRYGIEYEDEWGKQTYSPIEVVMQSVKSEKGEDISNDCRNIVFRNIRESRFKIGSKFRIINDFDSADREIKNIWLATNTNSVKMTSSMIIKRCTGTLGSLYKDAQGVSRYHYEPAIIESNLSGVSLQFNQSAVSPGAALLITVQHNDYTRDYFMNQRFIIGYDAVYRIKGINKFYSNTTFDPENVGLITLYLEITESSEYDDFVNRIAYQSVQDVIFVPTQESGGYSIEFTAPDVIPTYINSTPITFTPVVKDKSGNIVEGVTPVLNYSIENLPASVSPGVYIDVATANDGSVTISRKKMYLRGNLVLEWTVPEDKGLVETDFSNTFKLSLRQPE